VESPGYVLPADASPLQAPAAPYLVRPGAWPYGTADAIAADGARDLLFLGSGGAVLAMDASQPLTPTLLSDDMRTLGYVEDLFYDPTAQLLYVATGEGGLEIWDLQTPAAPQRLSAIEVYYGGVDVPILGVAVAGDMAYVAADWGWLHWVDVSDPTNPIYAGGEAERLRAEEVFVDGGYVYFVGDTGSSFILGDLSKYQIQPNGSLSFVAGRNFGSCDSFLVDGSLGYLGCGSFYILDVSDPTLPTLSSFSGVHSYGTAVSGTHVYLSNYSTGLEIVDVTSPTNPIQAGVYDSPGLAKDVTFLGGPFAYLADDRAGLRVVDVSQPMTPTEVAAHDTFSWARYADVQGDYAYVAEVTDGLAVIDVSQPATPTLAGHYPTPEAIYDVAVQADYAYLADVERGVRILDISQPTTPTEIGAYDAFDAFRIDVEGDYAYVIHSIPNEPYWLRVLDVSNPISPTEVGALQMPETALIWRVVARGDYAYVADDEAGLRIVDISDPANPTFAGLYVTPDVWDVALQGDYAYVTSADWDGGFLILDVSDPTNPTLASLYNPSGWFHPRHVDVSGRYAYVTRDYELHLFDVADPYNPVHLETVSLPLDVSGLDVSGPYVYAADGNAGLQIYENTLSAYVASLGPDSVIETLPGALVTHTFTLTNDGETDRYTLTVSGPEWPTTLLATSPVTVPALSSITIPVQVDVPHLPIEVIHAGDTFTLTADSSGDPGLVLTTTGTTRAATQPAISLVPATQAQAAYVGTTVTYTFGITNSGDYSDTFSLAVSSDWPANPSPSTGLLAPGMGAPLTLTVQVPMTATHGAQDTAVLTATSALHEEVTATAQATTTAQWNRLFLPMVVREG
jgi:hypothetical protein